MLAGEDRKTLHGERENARPDIKGYSVRYSFSETIGKVTGSETRGVIRFLRNCWKDHRLGDCENRLAIRRLEQTGITGSQCLMGTQSPLGLRKF